MSTNSSAVIEIATHSQRTAVIRHFKDVIEGHVYSSGVPLDHMVNLGLSLELAKILCDNLNVTSMTSVQAGIIAKHLACEKGANGQPTMRNFHLGTGPATGRTLTHAIVVIDHLIKFREWVASMIADSSPSVADDSFDVSSPPAFGTGTFHAVIVCSTHRRARQIHDLYSTICQDLGIVVARLPRISSHQSLPSIIETISALQVTIAIVGQSQISSIMKAVTKYQATAPGYGAETESSNSNTQSDSDASVSSARPHDDRARRLFADTKVVVYEDPLVHTDKDRGWYGFPHEFNNYIKSPLSAMPARILVSERNFYGGMGIFNTRCPGSAQLPQYFEARDGATPVTRDVATWRLHPKLVLRAAWTDGNISWEDNMQWEAIVLLGLESEVSRHIRTILVTANRLEAEKLYRTYTHRFEHFEQNAARFLPSSNIRGELQTFKSGERDILFTSADSVRTIGRVFSDQVILFDWERQDLSDIDYMLASTIPTKGKGPPPVVHMLINSLHGGTQLRLLRRLYETRDKLDFIESDSDALIQTMAAARKSVGTHVNLARAMPGNWAQEWALLVKLEREMKRAKAARELQHKVTEWTKSCQEPNALRRYLDKCFGRLHGRGTSFRAKLKSILVSRTSKASKR